MPRRGENIYKRKDGRWEGRCLRPEPGVGEPKYTYVYGKTYSEAKQKLLQVRLSQTSPTAPPTQKIKYGGVLQAWLAVSRIRVKESTYARYVHLIRNHLLPYLGKYDLEHLHTQVIEQHILFLLSGGKRDGSGGLAPKTVSDILVIIKGSLEYAACTGIRLNCNLNKLTIKKRRPEMRVLSPEEQERLLQLLVRDMDLYKFGVLLCLYTGIRIGEACALKWDCIDFEKGLLTIRETLQRIQNTDPDSPEKTKVVITEPKSKSAVRQIPLPDCLLALAKGFRRGPRVYLLSGSADRFVEPRTLQYHFKKYAAACGLTGVNYHALRHTFATRCIELGFDAKTLSEILGHANVNITLDRYVHSSLEAKRRSMQKLQL